MISIERARELLGALADGKTDEQIAATITRTEALADCIIAGFRTEQRRIANATPATQG